MMLYPAMNELLEQVPSRYQLVNVVAARARKIAAKAEREDLMLEDKPVTCHSGGCRGTLEGPGGGGRDGGRIPGRGASDPRGSGHRMNSARAVTAV